jgi:hypothetical protein
MARTLAASEPSAPVSTLRGAGVEVDLRRVAVAFVGLVLVSLAALVVVFYVAAFHNNSQITSLKERGVPVEITVSKCLGLLGGSGSNAAGYSCQGTFIVGHHLYDVNIPGSVLRAPGSRLKAISVRGNPTLISTVQAVATESASWRAFILPTSLLVVLALLGGVLVFRRRRRAQHLS